MNRWRQEPGAGASRNGRNSASAAAQTGRILGLHSEIRHPIEQATTTSLAALKAYAEGDKERFQGKEAESIPSYKMAIELDPNFAIAYARLGAVYANEQSGVLSDEYVRKAFERREHVSEKEKLYIAAHYYASVTSETEKVIETYELWRQVYPRDWIPANNVRTNTIASAGWIKPSKLPNQHCG